MVSLLVENGANVNAVSKAGETPFQRAVSLGFDDIAGFMAEHGCDLHKHKSVEQTASSLTEEVFEVLVNRLRAIMRQSLTSLPSIRSLPVHFHSISSLNSVLYAFIPEFTPSGGTIATSRSESLGAEIAENPFRPPYPGTRVANQVCWKSGCAPDVFETQA